MALNACKACYQGTAIEGFEFRKLAAVDDAGDYFVNIDLGFEICAHDAVKFCGVVEGFFPGSGLRG
jgi:hypothetical protein